MDADEKDDVPMLTTTNWPEDKNEDSLRRFSYRNRSVSMCNPMSFIKSNSNATNLVGFTGPLRSERKTPEIQMSSGPSYVNRRQGNSSRPVERKEPLKETHARMKNNNWGDSDYEAKNEHLLRAGQLGMCNDPYCTICPTSYNHKEQMNSRASLMVDPHFHNVLYGEAKGWASEKFSLLKPYIFGVMNPHAKVVQQWNQFFLISCLLAIFIDPLFFHLLSVDKDSKCIVINMPMTKIIMVFRSMTDFIFLMHMLLQFRLAFVSPETRVVGSGDLVDHPKKIALNYLYGFFLLDLFIVLPLPQIIVLYVLRKTALSGAHHAKDLLRTEILVQYVPRLYRFMPLLAGQSPSGFIFELAWANFVINLLTFVLSAHVVGSCWYLFGLQRVNQCFRDACVKSGINQGIRDACVKSGINQCFRDASVKSGINQCIRDACGKSGIANCTRLTDCGYWIDDMCFKDYPTWENWKQDGNCIACLNVTEDGFLNGIYEKAVTLSTESSTSTRYIYSFFWGFQQISTLAGNQTPSYVSWEVLFTMGIIGLGLLLFALLIGNMQNFLQGLGRRRLEMSLRRRDVEQWMIHRHFPEDLRRKVREAEHYNWAATRGVNEEMLMENLPEDLQRDLRRHLFKFVKKVRIFALLDEPILDAICERLRQKTYIKGGRTLYEGGLVTTMVFIVRGKMESVGENGNKVVLSEGDVCGEELLTWCLEHSSINEEIKKHRKPAHKLLSNRTVKCLTNVEAFVLRAADLEEVTSVFARFLRNPRVQVAIRNESPYWRNLAATYIQAAWRLRKKRLTHPNASASLRTLPSKYCLQLV